MRATFACFLHDDWRWFIYGCERESLSAFRCDVAHSSTSLLHNTPRVGLTPSKLHTAWGILNYYVKWKSWTTVAAARQGRRTGTTGKNVVSSRQFEQLVERKIFTHRKSERRARHDFPDFLTLLVRSDKESSVCLRCDGGGGEKSKQTANSKLDQQHAAVLVAEPFAYSRCM